MHFKVALHCIVQMNYLLLYNSFILLVFFLYLQILILLPYNFLLKYVVIYFIVSFLCKHLNELFYDRTLIRSDKYYYSGKLPGFT